jgi:tetratricopeptide (TPR) repeat protein
VGLLHFYIHAAQMARTSQSAVRAADRLAAFSLPPEDSHLTQMPGHTYFDVGMYDAALDVAKRSVAMDEADFACCHPGYYSAPRYYHDHNVEFLLYALTETGHAQEASVAARQSGDPTFIAKQLVAAGDWQVVLAVPYAPGKSATLAFARGLAYAKLADTARAARALAEIPGAPKDSPSEIATTAVMRRAIGGEIALAEHDDAKALRLFTESSASASALERLDGAEMAAFYYYSPHIALAELAVTMGRVDVANAALQAELVTTPRSPAALRALAQLKP